jgi:hypothetical protein
MKGMIGSLGTTSVFVVGLMEIDEAERTLLRIKRVGRNIGNF